MAKNPSRVNGKNGESMWVTEDELCFRTAGKVHKMARADMRSLMVVNPEDARRLVGESDLVPYGAWTEEMPSVGGKSLFLTAQSESDCWVMEITKNQVPNAQAFAGALDLVGETAAGDVPTLAITTPVGGLMVIGEVICILGAVFCVFSLEQPVVGLILAIAACIMFFKAK